MKQDKVRAIVLAAGQGKRMQSDTAKQYLLLKNKPILYYSLKAFEDNSLIDSITLVVGKGEINYCKEHIIDKYSFKKVRHIIEGGAERYNSVYNALCIENESKYVLIHDGARPFLKDSIICDIIDKVKAYNACIVGVPTKDTIKVVNNDGIVQYTPRRDTLYQIQTPQAFAYKLIKSAYDALIKDINTNVTDDSMVLELMTNHSIQLIEGDYNNIKITTPHDLILAENILNSINM